MTRHLALASLLLVACRNPQPARPDARAPAPPRVAADATLDAAVDATVAAPDVSTDAPASYVIMMFDGSTPGLADAADAARREPPPAAPGVNTLTQTNSGAAWVRALDHEGRRASRVMVTAVDADGHATRRERQVTVTADPVVSLSAHAAGGHLWVSWITQRTGPGGAMELQSYAARLKADVTDGDAPIALDAFSVRRVAGDPAAVWWARPATQAIARDDGGALIVSTGRSDACTTQRAPRLPFVRLDHCAMWTEDRFAVDGTRTTFSRPLIAPVGVPGAFTTVPHGALYALTSRRETVRSAAVEAPYLQAVDGAQPRVHESVYFQRDLTFAWDGAGVAALGRPANGPLNAPRGFARFNAQARPLTPLRVNVQRQTEWAPYTVAPLRCASGHAVVTVRWAGGAMTLDPANAAQHFDLFEWANVAELALAEAPDGGVAPPGRRLTGLVWTGRALTGVVNGALRRWTCTPSGALALQPPSTIVPN